MNMDQKVTAVHLSRNAYLYVRQSTLRQVLENTESTQRQYALRQRALVLGWSEDQIIVVDCDQGHSGASTSDREGFQKLVAEVGIGKAGIVMGLEVSRLARNSADWHRLLEICALSDTLILDEDGLYDPGHFNDRLLLGLKGTMSDAELHILKARLQGGILSKARRGELKIPIPIGLVYDHEDRVVLDPDQQVQQAMRCFFETFRRTGSCRSTVRSFRRQGVKFPKRWRAGSGDVSWDRLTYSRALDTLHNPRYAGAFAFGRVRSRKGSDGKRRYQTVGPEQWSVLIKEAHPGYIDWAQYEQNIRRLSDNAAALGLQRKAGPPREGSALLQGMVVCGKCGKRMTVRYHQRNKRLTPDYVCQREGIECAKEICQTLPGAGVDEAVGTLLVNSITPLTLQVTLNVQQELQARAAEFKRLRQQEVQRAKYEAEQARVRYMHVDPNNRLVADTLESDWNNRLRALSEAQQVYEKQRDNGNMAPTEKQKAQVLALAADFPKLWKHPKTSARERKRMARLVLEDVTLIRDQTTISVQVRFKGGANKALNLPLPQTVGEQRKTPLEVVTAIDVLLNDHPEHEVADILTARGMKSGTGQPFTPQRVSRIRIAYRLSNRRTRLRQQGKLSAGELACRLGVGREKIRRCRNLGLLTGHEYKGGSFLYDDPGPDVVERMQLKRNVHLTAAHTTEEVQYAT